MANQGEAQCIMVRTLRYATGTSAIYMQIVVNMPTAFPSSQLLGYSFMLRSRNQTTNQIPRSFKNDGFDWPFDLVIVT